ncbi:unnamed protein product [Cochlearia groenlandica]
MGYNSLVSLFYFYLLFYNHLSFQRGIIIPNIMGMLYTYFSTYMHVSKCMHVSIYMLSLTLLAQHLYVLSSLFLYLALSYSHSHVLSSHSLSLSLSLDMTKKKTPSSKRLGGYLREQKGRLYIIRRCVVMLICWHD